MLSDALRHSLERCTKLPSLPAVVLRVVELARNPEVNLQEIVVNLSKDPVLSARLLSLANTVFYAQQKPVEDLQQAVSRIGLERTLALALGCSLVSTTESRAANGLDLQRYWQRSLICALGAKSLAESVGLEAESGALFTASLLQDIGMLALHATDTQRYLSVVNGIDSHKALVELEHQTYDTDHAEVGEWLARQWHLSERTCEWIRCSHDELQPADSREQKATNCIIAAGWLADAWLEGEAALSVVMASFERYFGLQTPEMLAKIMALQEQLPAVATEYRIALPEKLDANNLMFEAKLLLSDRNARLQQDLQRQQEEIEALRQQQRALSLQTRMDPLTRLYNRQHLEEMLHEFFAAGQANGTPLALLFIDLDRFKKINDRFGHVIGDEVLKNFARILRHLSDDEGGHAGRYGGEEFVVLLPGKCVEYASRFSKNLQRRLSMSALARVKDMPLYVTASYGIAGLDESHPFSDVDELLNAADMCMYKSKYQGGDCVTLHSMGDSVAQ